MARIDQDRDMLRITKDEGAAGPVVRLCVAGELDLNTSGQLADAVRTAVDVPGLRRLEVDLGEVTFMDSSGLRVLVIGHADAKKRGGALTAVNVPPNIRRTLDITGLADVLIG
jgi:anti-sigma B factor antagonist